MQLMHKVKTTTTLLKQRNFAYISNAFLMLLVGVLMLTSFTKSERIILIPAMNDMKKQYVFEGKHIPDSYLWDWSFKILSDIFTANPKTIGYKNTQFLQLALSSALLSQDLERTASTLKKDNISTAFYPEFYQLNREEKEIQVEGRFLTFFGKSQKPILKQKTFVLGWEVMPSGVIAIRSLKEIKHAK